MFPVSPLRLSWYPSHSFARSITVPGSRVSIQGMLLLAASQPFMRAHRQHLCSWRSLLSPPPSSPAKTLWLSSWLPRSSFSATTDLLLQWTWSAHSCLPRLCCCRALPERAAPAHWVTLWQSLKTKKKNALNTLTYHPGSLQQAQKRRACKCSFFFTDSFSFPWYYLPSLQSSHLPSPSWQFPIPWRELTSISRNKSLVFFTVRVGIGRCERTRSLRPFPFFSLGSPLLDRKLKAECCYLTKPTVSLFPIQTENKIA